MFMRPALKFIVPNYGVSVDVTLLHIAKWSENAFSLRLEEMGLWTAKLIQIYNITITVFLKYVPRSGIVFKFSFLALLLSAHYRRRSLTLARCFGPTGGLSGHIPRPPALSLRCLLSSYLQHTITPLTSFYPPPPPLLAGHGLILEVSRSLTTTHHSR